MRRTDAHCQRVGLCESDEGKRTEETGRWCCGRLAEGRRSSGLSWLAEAASSSERAAGGGLRLTEAGRGLRLA